MGNNKNIDSILCELHNEDFLARCDAVSELAEYTDNQQVVNSLIDMLNDTNYLVRCEACDSLYGIMSYEVLSSMFLRLKKERSTITRMYILSTMCSIIKKTGCSESMLIELEELFKREKSKRVMVAYMCVLYVIKRDKMYIKRALSFIDDENYHMRCNVISLVNDVVDSCVVDIIALSYTERLKREKAYCVIDLLENSLSSVINSSI